MIISRPDASHAASGGGRSIEVDGAAVLQQAKICRSLGEKGREFGADPFMLHLFAALAEKERAVISQRT